MTNSTFLPLSSIVSTYKHHHPSPSINATITMDPQLLMPSPAAEFNFDSTSTSPYATAPSSPKTLFPKFYLPTSTNDHGRSPINQDAAADDIDSTDRFKSNKVVHELKNEDLEEDDMDFAFEFSGQLERPSISDADELFDGGKIKPLEPQPVPTRSYGEIGLETPKPQTQNLTPRGRERTVTNARHKVSRSLSPLGVSDTRLDDHKVSTTQSTNPFGFTWYNKWNLKNLLLFRSTSEGSATTSDNSIKKYAMITKGDQDTKNSSFRSCDGGGSLGGSSRRRMKRKMSAHEMHYTANRAVAEEMRRKTFLPYKSGLLGCLGFTQDLREVSRRR